MNNIKILLAMFIRVFSTLYKVKSLSFNNKDADYIVWAPNFFSLRFFFGDNLQKVSFTYYYLRKFGRKVTIYTRRDIGCFNNKRIIFFGGDYYNIYKFNNYADALINVADNLLAQNNAVFPNSIEVRLWENKAYMHEYFNDLRIRTPSTSMYHVNDAELFSVKQFPLLVKDEHSCSAKGVHKITTAQQLQTLIFDRKFCQMNKIIILQNLLNIRRDLRVILIGDEIVLHYWRINLSAEWKPTSTGHGSKVDFESFPEVWREWIIDNFKKLGMKTGAFDIAWENDDLSTEPYILEVSPFYQPNPMPQFQENLINYGLWKKSIRIRDSYQLGMVKVIDRMQCKFVEEFIKIHG